MQTTQPVSIQSLKRSRHHGWDVENNLTDLIIESTCIIVFYLARNPTRHLALPCLPLERRTGGIHARTACRITNYVQFKNMQAMILLQRKQEGIAR
jgi:hypothetical protein